MMNFSEFKDYVKENIKTYLPDTYQDADVTLTQITKTNDTVLDAIIIKKSDEINATPTIYLNSYYKEYEAGREMRDILHDISGAQQRYELDEKIDITGITDYEKVKDKIVPRVVSVEKNEILLKDTPHTVIGDLAVTYHIEIGNIDQGKMTTAISNGILENLGISTEELHRVAMENIGPVIKPRLMSMREMLIGMMEGMPEEMLPPEDPAGMHILTSHDKTHGAVAMLDEKTMDMVQEKLGDFYILPSSLHEIIILPDDGQVTVEALEKLVQEVNETQVAENERLSDHVYRYDKDTKEIYRADKAEEHFKEVATKREVSKVKVKEKDGEKKPSVMENLKAKKQEAEKTPAKIPAPGKKRESVLA